SCSTPFLDGPPGGRFDTVSTAANRLRPLPDGRAPSGRAENAREPVRRHAGQHAGAEQRRGRSEQLQHVRQTPPDPRPPSGSPNPRVKVTAGQSRAPALRWPRHGPEAVVRARGQLPGGSGRPRQPTLENPTSARTAVRLLTQPAVQNL